MKRILNAWIILAIAQRTVFCSRTCAELEFSGISKNTISARDGTNVTLHFHLNTKQCSEIPDEFNIKVFRDRNGRLFDLCRIRLKLAEGNCDLSDASTSCCCPSSDGKMLFFKQVTKDDEGVYLWKWSEKLGEEEEKIFTLNVDGPAMVSLDTMTTLSTPDAKPEPVAKQPEVEGAPTIITRASHQQRVENPVDTRLIISSVILGGVVVVAVIGAVLIFCLRGRRSNKQVHASCGAVEMNTYLLPSSLPVPRDQASDIYDEIPDCANLQRPVSRVCSGSPSQIHLQRSSVNAAQLESLKSDEVHCVASSVEYLHPVRDCTEQNG